MIRLFFAAIFCAGSAAAQDTNLRLAVPDALETSGIIQFVVPRFSLKTGVRFDRVPEGEAAEMRFGTEGDAVFTGIGQVWALTHNDDPRAVRFLEWLKSDIGKRTVESFNSASGDTFSGELRVARVEKAPEYSGDEAEGERLSLLLCGRCHVINESNRMNGMGSTPSFRLLRSLGDWGRRFESFHLLNPHPSFTQIENVTEAFDPSRPSPIVPVHMTLEDLDAILAYVALIEPADLGAPLQHQ